MHAFLFFHNLTKKRIEGARVEMTPSDICCKVCNFFYENKVGGFDMFIFRTREERTQSKETAVQSVDAGWKSKDIVMF